MNERVKRIIATTAAAAVITAAGIATAQDSDKLYINGTLSENGSIEVVGEKRYLPLRALCEGLGFEVEWDEASRKIIISSIPIYITCSPDRDGYTFAKTAPMLLGEAPMLINDKTYVPMNFVDEILEGKIEEKADGINVVYATAEENNEVLGTVCEIIYDGEKPVQLVLGDKDDINSQTILNLSDELSAKVVELGIDVGINIVAEVTDLATASIPPQMIPVSICVAQEAEAEENDGIEEVSGVVCDMIYDNDKLVQLVTGEKDNPMNQLVFNLSDELSKKVAELGIEEGTKIKGTAKRMVTMSIPPQQPLLTLEIDE